jgi:hypothetical protein
MYRATAEEIVLTNRLASLLFGIFAWPDADETRMISEAGSGIFIAPRFGLTARHVVKSFERHGHQSEALNRRQSILEPQYVGRIRQSDFPSMIYQVPQFNASPVDEEQIKWKPVSTFQSHDTDIASVLAEPRTVAAANIESEQRFLEWHLLPPPVGCIVRIYGLPGQKIQSDHEYHHVNAAVWRWNARVQRHHRLFAHGFADFPVYELDQELPGGFSGAPVIYRGRLAGIFIGPTLVACLWPLALHKCWDEQQQEVLFADYFDARVIPAWDWDEVKGRVHRVPCEEVVAGLDVESCNRMHVILSD